MALLALVFVGGAAAGAAVISSWNRVPDLPPIDAASVSVDGDPFATLDLTDTQQAQVDAILAEMGSATDSVLERSRLVLTEEATRAKARIRGVLSPEQAVRFDSLMEDLGDLRVKVTRRMIVDQDSSEGTP